MIYVSIYIEMFRPIRYLKQRLKKNMCFLFMPFIHHLIIFAFLGDALDSMEMEMVNIHADLRHAFKPPESGGTLESSVDGGFFLHACSRAIGKVKTLRVTPCLFFVSGAIVSFSSCVLKATSQTYDDGCFEHARLSLFTIRHRVSQSRADRWQHLGSQFASLIHHSWSFSKVL